MLGVSFQPGSNDYGQQNGNGQPSSGSGVQEAIKILSLRLPRVMGAQSAVPMPLLTSQGSGGNPRIDSIVNQVLSRIAPGQAMPNFAGPSPMGQQSMQPRWQPPAGFTPRVTIDNPMGQPMRWPGQQSGTDANLGSGGGQPPGMFEPVPNTPIPKPPPAQVPAFGDIGRRLNERTDYPGGGHDGPFDQPLF